MTVDMCSCKPGDILISKHGERLVYIKQVPSAYFPHIVKYSNGGHGTRTDEGFVGKNKRYEQDHDIVKIEPISNWESFLFQITEEEMKQMIADHEQFSKAGMIGDCLLRRKADEWLTRLGVDESRVVFIMRDLAFECYKYFSGRFFDMKRKFEEKQDAY